MITGWGIELPDGCALSVSTDDQAVAVCSRTIHCELLHSATLVWIDGDAGDLEEEKPT